MLQQDGINSQTASPEYCDNNTEQKYECTKIKHQPFSITKRKHCSDQNIRSYKEVNRQVNDYDINIIKTTLDETISIPKLSTKYNCIHYIFQS